MVRPPSRVKWRHERKQDLRHHHPHPRAQFRGATRSARSAAPQTVIPAKKRKGPEEHPRLLFFLRCQPQNPLLSTSSTVEESNPGRSPVIGFSGARPMPWCSPPPATAWAKSPASSANGRGLRSSRHGRPVAPKWTYSTPLLPQAGSPIVTATKPNTDTDVDCREHLEKKPQLPAKWLWSVRRSHPEIRTDWVRLNRAGRGFHRPDMKGAIRPPKSLILKNGG